jgi:hypothetical protein
VYEYSLIMIDHASPCKSVEVKAIQGLSDIMTDRVLGVWMVEEGTYVIT